MRITSLKNPRIKYIARLRDDPRQRKIDQLTLVEGWDEIRLAEAAGLRARTIITAEKLVRRPLEGAHAETIEVTPAIFQKLSHRQNPDGWMGLFPLPVARLENLRLSSPPLLMIVAAVEKPGNLGAILRTCDAAGVDALIACDPKADLFGPNVVRASRGTLFTVASVAVKSGEALEFLRERGIRIAAAAPAGQVEYTSQDLSGPLAIAVGAEDRGLSEDWLHAADATLKIPMRGRVNSLNVSVAAALILFEAVRQRAAKAAS